MDTIKRSIKIVIKNKFEQESDNITGNQQKAAIIVFKGFKELRELGVLTQINACNVFIKKQGWIVSDLFLKRKDGESIEFLARARAQSKQFDYVVSYVNFAHVSTDDGQNIGDIIACLDAESYAKGLVNAW